MVFGHFIGLSIKIGVKRMNKLVWVNRVYTKDFITDFFQDIRNIVGGRQKMYEQMINNAIQDCWDEFHKQYPHATNFRVDTEHMKDGAVMITITGEMKWES